MGTSVFTFGGPNSSVIDSRLGVRLLKQSKTFSTYSSKSLQSCVLNQCKLVSNTLFLWSEWGSRLATKIDPQILDMKPLLEMIIVGYRLINCKSEAHA